MLAASAPLWGRLLLPVPVLSHGIAVPVASRSHGNAARTSAGPSSLTRGVLERRGGLPPAQPLSPAVARRVQPSPASSAEARGSGTAPGGLKDGDRSSQVGLRPKSGFFSLPPAAPAQQQRWGGGTGARSAPAQGAAPGVSLYG